MLDSPYTIKRILFATDFLASSQLALDYAVAFAHHFKATIVMLHAVELPSPARAAETETHRPSVSRWQLMDRLETVAIGVRNSGIDVETYVEEGVPSDVILHAIHSHSADLLVLGIHGVHRGISHLLMGSNMEKILLAATCPTMTVGAQVLTRIDPTLHLNEILYFSDQTPAAIAAAPYANFLAREFNVPVDVCELLPESGDSTLHLRGELAAKAVQTSSSVGRAQADRSRPVFQLDRGMEFDQIIERSDELRAGLIVLGVQTVSQLSRHLHTSFAYQLLSKASCPVLTVRHNSSNHGPN